MSTLFLLLFFLFTACLIYFLYLKVNPTKKSDIKESWILVDAKDKTLGRLAVLLATRLRGKHKPEYTPNADLGDYVVVVNASKINVPQQMNHSLHI